MANWLKRLQKMGASLLGLATLAVMLVLQISDPAPFERLRMQIFDTYQSLTPREDLGEDKVVLVDIDEESISSLGQWPWPRADLARMTDRLAQAGAKAVVFDIVFSESDRTSPEAIVERMREAGQDSALIGQLAALPSYDEQLAQSFAEVPVVTGFFLARERRGREVEPKASFTLHGSMPSEHVPEFAGSLQPLPVLEEAATGNGFVSLDSDADGIVRRVPLVAIHRDTLIPSLSLEAVRVAGDFGSPNLLASDGSGETSASPGAAVSVRIGDAEIPVNDAGEMWVHFPSPGQQPTLAAGPIITGEISDAQLAEAVGGKILFIGGSAVGLQDLVSTPVSERIAGVTVHAAAVEQMLGGYFLQRPDWAFGLELFLVILLGAGFALLLPRLGAVIGAATAAIGIAAVFGASWLGFTQLQYLFDPTYPALALAVVYSVQTVAVYYREEQQRSYIHAAFDRFLSPELVRQIADDPGRLELGGEERDMSVLMCDIRGFSRISERYSPREVIDFLIEFLTPMSDILLSSKATLDKYIGDAILAFWNAPLDDPDHHRNAARAALEMSAKLAELNQLQPGKDGIVWPDDVRIGIGLNSGTCCVGNMGSKQRLSYSLIGDTVNVASRLEGLTKQYGVEIIVGEDMAAHLRDFALLELDHVRVVGRDNPERIYCLLGDEVMADGHEFAELTRVHAATMAAYRGQQWEALASHLDDTGSLYDSAGLSGLAKMYAARAEALSENPPGPDWDGVFTASEK
ncbi:MAG: adenylate/guanylate cyclase domain-containing protein [Sphingomonadales bacterium]|nr:MAG: adenylate/guanylate cyclase domain-containing protein [Sphingomonadales bacterium]